MPWFPVRKILNDAKQKQLVLKTPPVYTVTMNPRGSGKTQIMGSGSTWLSTPLPIPGFNSATPHEATAKTGLLSFDLKASSFWETDNMQVTTRAITPSLSIDIYVQHSGGSWTNRHVFQYQLPPNMTSGTLESFQTFSFEDGAGVRIYLLGVVLYDEQDNFLEMFTVRI